MEIYLPNYQMNHGFLTAFLTDVTILEKFNIKLQDEEKLLPEVYWYLINLSKHKIIVLSF